MAFDNDGKAVNIVAPADVTAGDFVYDEVSGWAGFALGTVAEGELVALEVTRAHRMTVLKSVGFALGDMVYLKDDGTLDDTPSSTVRVIGKVSEVTEVDATHDQIVINMFPQTWAKFAPTS